MNFFKTLSETGINDVVIQMKQDSTGNITVFVTPKTIAKDSALKGLKPLHLTGTPEEIDAEFFGLVTTPLVKTQTIFNNVEAFEAQIKEVEKATADKKSEKDAATKAKKDTEKTDSKEAADSPKETVVKEVKVNNEKVLKDFMTSIKGEDLLIHKDKIEELYANLSEVELGKPFNKKVRIDLDIVLRKEAIIQAAREKHGFATKTDIVTEEVKPVVEEIEVVEPVMTEMVSDVPEAIQEIAKESPNVIIATVPTPVEEQPIEVVKEITPVPPIPVTPVVIQYEDVEEFQMIATDFTKEEYNSVGWTDELLLQHNKAHYVTVKKEVTAESPKKLSYTFPKEFDAPEENEQ